MKNLFNPNPFDENPETYEVRLLLVDLMKSAIRNKKKGYICVAESYLEKLYGALLLARLQRLIDDETLNKILNYKRIISINII